MTDKDELFKGIDDATENLFGQYVVKSGQETINVGDNNPEAPSTPPAAAPEAAAPPPTTPPAGPEIELDLGTETSQTDAEEIFDEMEQAILSVDWEVSHSNISKAREVLSKLIKSTALTSDSAAGQVAEQMDVVFSSMLEAPEQAPVSAPSLLKNALIAVKGAHEKGEQPDPETRKKLSTVLSELHSVAAAAQTGSPPAETPEVAEIDTPDEQPTLEMAEQPSSPPVIPQEEPSLELEMSPLEDDPSGPSEPVSAEMAQVLREYSKTLDAVIKRIVPMENLFAGRDGMEKLYTVNKQTREKLTNQKELLTGTFSSNYSQYSGVGTVESWLESQLDILTPCVKRMTKLESLFKKTSGYEKLYDLTSKIRKMLSDQEDSITEAVGGSPADHQFDLTGEYPTLEPSRSPVTGPPAAVISAAADATSLVKDSIDLAMSIETGSASNIAETSQELRENLEKALKVMSGSSFASPSAAAAATTAIMGAQNTKCRWDWLLKATWGGQLVGFAPEQVVYEGQSTLSAKAFRDKTTFPLKKLKSMPWTNLQNLFSGDLAEVDKPTLSSMELDIATPPDTFPGSSKKKLYMIILYIEGRGKVFLLDTPTDPISVADEGIWKPGIPGSEIAGTLTFYGSTMPVISID